jgi:hypothetical protein
METTTPKNWLIRGMYSALGRRGKIQVYNNRSKNQQHHWQVRLSWIDSHTLNRDCRLLRWRMLKSRQQMKIAGFGCVVGLSILF